MKKIVLIEDDSDLFGLLKYNLEKEGFGFAGSQTGKGAIELCRRERPDLVILDIMLPDSDGLDICKGLRNHSELANVPIIFLTARGLRNRPHSRTGAGRERLYRQTILHPRIDRPHQEPVPHANRAGADRSRRSPGAGPRQLPRIAARRGNRPNRHRIPARWNF